MKEVDIHGYKIKYDPDEVGSAGEAGVHHLLNKVDQEEAHDLFRGAKIDDDHRTRLDFYDHNAGVDRKLRISYNGDGTYRLRKAA